MKKGRMHIAFPHLCALAFFFAILRLSPLCLLVFLLALLVEKDRFTCRQSLQALCLSVVDGLLGLLPPFLLPFLPLPEALLTPVSVGIRAFSALVYALCITFSILGITRVVRESEARLPIFSHVAARLFPQEEEAPSTSQG